MQSRGTHERTGGASRLPDRGVVTISGADSRAFLERIVTCDTSRIAMGTAAYGALLSPQGKIASDFFLFAQPSDEGLLLDAPAAATADLVRRLALYRLRAKIAITDASGELAVAAGWGGAPPPPEALAAATDPRLPALGWRAILPADAAPPVDLAAYEAHRIALGVPEGGRDFAFGDAFPHEALLDQLHGVAFDKGCYVGQEVVSRMQHRGTARTRVVPVRYDGEAVAPDMPITAGDKVVGRTGSSSGREGLATVRIDRVQDAYAAGDILRAGETSLSLVSRDWIGFPIPERAPDDAS